MKSTTTQRFGERFNRLPQAIQRQSAGRYALWRNNPRHPSLHFKQIKRLVHPYPGRTHLRLGGPFWILDCGFWIKNNPKSAIQNPKWHKLGINAIALHPYQ